MSRRIGRELAWAALAAALGLGAFRIAATALHTARGAWRVGGGVDTLLHEWMKDGPGAWVALGLLAAALSYAARAALALRRHDDSPSAMHGDLRILAAGGAASSVAFVATVIGSVYARRVVAPTVTEAVRTAYFRFFFSGDRVAHEIVMWLMTGAGLVLLAALWGGVGVAWARRRSPGSALPIITILGLASVVGVAGTSLLLSWSAISSLSDDTEWIPHARLYELILGTGEPLVQGRWALIGVAVIAAFVIVVAARGARPRPAAPREMVAAAGLFALGLGAFAITRGAAHDALHPLPYREGSVVGWLDDDTAAALPRGEQCTPGAQDHPTIAVSANGRVRLNGGGWQDAAELQKALESMKTLWLQVQPGKRFPGRLEAVIPGGASMAAVAPALAAVRAAGYAGLDVIEELPRQTYVTRTLGEISYRPRVCYVPIEVTVVFPRQGTWGDFARSLPAP